MQSEDQTSTRRRRRRRRKASAEREEEGALSYVYSAGELQLSTQHPTAAAKAAAVKTTSLASRSLRHAKAKSPMPDIRCKQGPSLYPFLVTTSLLLLYLATSALWTSTVATVPRALISSRTVHPPETGSSTPKMRTPLRVRHLKLHKGFKFVSHQSRT